MELASRQRRLVGSLVDAALALVPYGLMQLDSDPLIVLGMALFLALIIVQCTLLTRTGQTIGKRVAKTRIVREATDDNGGFVTNVLMRAVVASLPNIIPVYWIVDALFIFREDRKCVHDWIAGTRVVRVEA